MNGRLRTAAFGAAAILALVGVAGGAGPRRTSADTRQERAFYVNTTQDLVLDPQLCLPGRPCTFRAAVMKAESFGAPVRVCFEGNCPAGQLPLSEDDPNYDPRTGKWTLRFNVKLQSLIIGEDEVDVDFSANVDGWGGPQDNRIIVSSGITTTNYLILIEGSRNKLAGFDIDGKYEDAAILLRNGASNNQIGPGMVLAGFPEGKGIRILDAGTTGNRIVGSWCGFRINEQHEPVADGLVDDCVHIAEGASENWVGGPEPADGNVLSATELGYGVSVHDPATRNNTIQHNFIGTDPSGTKAAPNESGIGIFTEATNTKVLDNLISGNENVGLFATDASTQFGRTSSLVEGNRFGLDISGTRALPNGAYAVELRGLSKDIKIAHNTMMYNRSGGVLVCDEQTRNNTMTENVITANGGDGIRVCTGANDGVLPPVVESGDMTSVQGTACPLCRIEVFSDPAEQAAVFEGAVDAGPDGRFSFVKAEGTFANRNITTTATEGQSTSGLSKVKVISRPTLTPTAIPGRTPSPTALPSATTLVVRGSIFMPCLERQLER